MFEGFEQVRVETEGASINAVRGGEGPPVLLLHGYPQTLAMWHLVAPRIADSFTVVAADLRGYGDSSRPEGGEDHAGYSKRAMALDQVVLMRELGFDTFAVAGHDRGARVAHRMALDHPDYFFGKTLGAYGTSTQVFAPEAYAEYERYFRDPKTIHAMCEDYRAAATIDLDHDEADRGRKVGCPLLALWGGRV